MSIRRADFLASSGASGQSLPFTNSTRRSQLLSVLPVLLVAFAFANIYWIAEFLYAPTSPASIHNLYQTDQDYFPPTYNLSRGHVSEFGALEKRGTIFPFPIAGMSTHAAFLRLFGDRGWMIADFLVTAGVIAFLFWLFRCIVQNDYFAALATLLLILYSTGPNLLEYVTHHLFLGDMWVFWAYRFYRPLVTTLFILLQLYAAVAVLRAMSLRQLRWRAACIGIACAILMQADIHAASTACMISVAFLGWSGFRLSRSFSQTLGVLGAYGLTLLVVVSPFLYQASLAAPDLKGRWGTILIARSHPLFLPHTLQLSVFGIAAIIILRLLVAWQERLDKPGDGWRWAQAIIVVLASFLASIVALPLSIVFLGQGVQMGHFLDRCMRYRTLLIVCLLTATVNFSLLHLTRWRPNLKWLRPQDWSVRLKFGSALVLLAMPVAFYFKNGLRSWSPEIQVRTFEGWPAVPGYRAAFEQLAGFLSQSYNGSSPLVLGTFDVQVRVWWQAKKGQWLYLPDPAMTTLADEEIESRLFSFCQLLGFSEQNFVDALRNYYFNVTFLSALKYQIFSYYHFGSLDDYEPSQINNVEWYSAQIVVPKSVLGKLKQKFQPVQPLVGQLDLIVLNKANRFADYQVPPDRFDRVFQNSEFEVWQSVSSAQSGH
jgi:hypothetical protein